MRDIRGVCVERAQRRNHNRKVVLNAQKSAEAIVPCGGKTQGKGGTNTRRSNRRKEDGMKNAENIGSCPHRDSTECKGVCGSAACCSTWKRRNGRRKPELAGSDPVQR